MIKKIGKALFLGLMVTLWLSGCATVGGVKQGYKWEGKSMEEIGQWVCKNHQEPEKCNSYGVPTAVFMPRDELYAQWLQMAEDKGAIDDWYKAHSKEEVDSFLEETKVSIVGYWDRDAKKFYVCMEESNCEIESQLAYAITIHIIEQMEGPIDESDEMMMQYQLQARQRAGLSMKNMYYWEFCSEEENASSAEEAK